MRISNLNTNLVPWPYSTSTQTVHFKWMLDINFMQLFEVAELSDDTFVGIYLNNKSKIYEKTKYKSILCEKQESKNKKKSKSRSKSDVFKNQLMLRKIINKNDDEDVDYNDVNNFRSIVVFLYRGTDEEKAGQLSVNILGSISTDEIYDTAELILEQILKKNPYVIRADFNRSIFNEKTKEYEFEEGALEYVKIINNEIDDLMKMNVNDINIIFDNIIVNFRTNDTIELQNLQSITDSDKKFIFMMNDPKTNTVRFQFISHLNNKIHVHFKRTGRCNINKVKSIEEAEEAIQYIYDIFQKHKYLIEVTDTQLDKMSNIECIKATSNIVNLMSKYRCKI